MKTDEIIAGLSVDLVRRMRNWARANAGLVPGQVRAVDPGAQPTSGYAEANMPCLEGEANDTEIALSRVPLRYQQAVRQFWAYEGRSMKWHAMHTGKAGVHAVTFEDWLRQGHERFEAELRALIATWRARAAGNAVMHRVAYHA